MAADMIVVCPWCSGELCYGECEPGRQADLIVDIETVRRESVCMDCDTPFEVGQRFSERLTGFVGETPVTEMICVPCGLRGEPVDVGE